MSSDLQHQNMKKTILKCIHVLWWDWLGCMEKLIVKLKEQEQLFIQGDFKSVDKLQVQLIQLHHKLNDIVEDLSVNLKKLAFIFKCDPSIENILTFLSGKEHEELSGIITQVKAVSQDFNDQMRLNKMLIQNEVTYLSGLMMIMSSNECKGKTPYNPSISTPLLMDQQT